jgi:hypothetical protein
MQTTTSAGIVITVMGFIVLMVTQSITVYVPDRIDVAKRVIDDLQVIQSNEISTAWKNAASHDLNSFDWSQQDLNEFEMYQKAVSAKEIGYPFAFILMILGSILSIVSPVSELLPRLL